ncbi:MAG: phage tail sheath subtilisin-like domain-containing protein [Gaiellaceae bacterium]
MAEIEYPGVYVEEVSLGVAPIAGVETSTTGLIGTVGSAEPCALVHVRSLVEFERAFARIEAGFKLGAAVARFFENGGSDAWVVGLPDGVPLSAGLERLDAVDTLSLLCLPGETDVDVLRAAIEYAERRRAFALIDPPGTDIDRAIAYVEALAQGGSANAAVYFPPFEGADPPSGAVAGMYARVDRARGVWKAPAGEEAVLRGAVSTAVDLTEDESSTLNSAAVNTIRRFPDKGVLVWGARTIQGADQGSSDWKYVPVRRLGLYVEHSIDRGTQWAIFEPNSEPTWAKLRQQIGVFLTGLFQMGAFAGRTPDESYFVRCGNDTMTQDDIDNGRLNMVIGIAPLKPAEFVILKIGQWRDHLPTPATACQHQLSALDETHELLTRSGIDYWLFGGWAVDFHVGSITRPHDDIDIAVWLDDRDRIARWLEAEGWKHAPDADEDGGTGYERAAVRLELTFVVRGPEGKVYVPLRAGRVLWFDGPPSVDVAQMAGVRARVLGLAELKRGKSRARDDPGEAAKDRADFAALSRVG